MRKFFVGCLVVMAAMMMLVRASPMDEGMNATHALKMLSSDDALAALRDLDRFLERATNSTEGPSSGLAIKLDMFRRGVCAMTAWVTNNDETKALLCQTAELPKYDPEEPLYVGKMTQNLGALLIETVVGEGEDYMERMHLIRRMFFIDSEAPPCAL